MTESTDSSTAMGPPAGRKLGIKENVTTCDNTNGGASGTQTYAGVLGTAATRAIFGSAAQGGDSGDRSIAGASNEVLCFNVTLPLAATNAAQGITYGTP